MKNFRQKSVVYGEHYDNLKEALINAKVGDTVDLLVGGPNPNDAQIVGEAGEVCNPKVNNRIIKYVVSGHSEQGNAYVETRITSIEEK